MKIDNFIISAALVFLFSQSVLSQEASLPRVSDTQLRKHIDYLASDGLKGRGITSPELMLAANYLKEHLQEMGLTSPKTGFFQPFILTSSHFDVQHSFLTTISPRGKEKSTEKNFIALNQTSNVVDIEGELVFAGFGPTGDWSDSSGPEREEIRGKIVLYSAGSQMDFIKKGTYSWNNPFERKKMDKLLEAGAKALVLVTSLQDSACTTYRHFERLTSRQNFSFQEKQMHENPKVFIITPGTADRLVGKRLKWKKILKLVSANGSFRPASIKNYRIRIHSVMTEKKVEAKNVIGIVEGRDPDLKKECIVFTAHYDHLGRAENGEIYSGADDNASGVATLLEVAAMFSNLTVKPRRSLLFLFPSAEETGLLGSGYYSLNPVFPMNKTTACINLDMVGRVYETRDSVWAGSPKQVKDFDGLYALVNGFNPQLKSLTSAACDQLGLKPDFSLPDRFFYTSDHYHFHKNKVPLLNLTTGYSADYHKTTDTAGRIRPDKMARIAQLCFLVGLKLGNQE